MVEPEFTFSNLQDNIILAQKVIKTVIRDVLNNCNSELKFLEQKQETKNEQSLIEKIRKKLPILNLILKLLLIQKSLNYF